MDPTIIRVIFIVLAFVQGIGILAYLVLALVVPNEPALATEPAPPPPPPRPEPPDQQLRRRNQRLLGTAIIALGALLLLTSFNWWAGPLWWNPLWALALVVLGTVLLVIKL